MGHGLGEHDVCLYIYIICAFGYICVFVFINVYIYIFTFMNIHGI